MSEPREWWITNRGSHISYADDESEVVHVIEKAAFDALKAELADTQRKLTEAWHEHVTTSFDRDRNAAHVAELKAENVKLKATLQILAEHEPSWSDDFCRARNALGLPNE